MGIKDSNEITVKIKGKIEDLHAMLEERGYKIINKFNLDDYYYIPLNLDVEKITAREILSKAVIVREINNEMHKDSYKRITFKIKKFDDNGNILQQKAINCEVANVEDAKKLLSAIGYKEIMNIKENDVVYEKDKIQLATKDIINGDKLIEIETEDIDGLRTIEELKEIIKNLDIPIETDDFFVKKAEIELNKIMKKY